MSTIGWVVIGIVIVLVLRWIWRVVTARYSIGRKMLGRLSDDELGSLDKNMLRQEGLEGVYQDELKQRGIRKD